MRNAERMFSRQCAEEDLSPGSTGNAGMTIWSSKTKQEKHGKIHHRSIWRICSKPATKWHMQAVTAEFGLDETAYFTRGNLLATYCKLGGQL